MKIAISQLNYHIGNFEGNLNKMLEAVKWAKGEGVDIICFSELSTCGYPPRDFLEFDDFIHRAEQSITTLKEASHDIGIAVGSPTVNPVIEGKDLHNSGFFLYNGEVLHVAHKALLPTYDIFDEYRYFEPGNTFDIIEFKGKKIALTICEDIWNVDNANPLYTICPMDELIKLKPDFMINLSASPFNYNQAEERLGVIKANIDRYGIPMFYVNHCGAQTEIIFDGGSVVMAPDGSYDEAPYFEAYRKIYDLDEVHKGFGSIPVKKDKIALIHDALVLGVRDYFGKLGFTKAILGLSGGIDSAVTAALAAEALGAENVRCVLMPSQFSSDHSVNDARQLALNMGAPFDIIPIKPAYDTFMEMLSEPFQDTTFNVTEENIQARSRGLTLMALSNKIRKYITQYNQ